jgi:PKD domain
MRGLGGVLGTVRTAARLSLAIALALACSSALLGVASASAAPTWLSPASVTPPGDDSNEPQVAVNTDGEAVAVWAQYNGSHEVVQASVRPATGGGWQTPVTLSDASQNASSPRVAIDSEGEAIVVWERYNGSHYVVQASVRPAPGESWQTPVNLSETSNTGYRPEIAIAPNGEAIVAWELWNGSHSFIQASVRPAPGESWQTPVNLSETSHEAYAAQLAINAQNEAVAVWEFSNGSYLAAQASARPSGGSWQTPVNLSETGKSVFQPHLALNDEGEALASWALFSGSKEVMQTAGRPGSGASWRTPVTLAEGEFKFPEEMEQQVAIDAQGDAVAVWTQRSGSHEMIKAAARSGPGAGESWQTPAVLADGGSYFAEEPDVAISPQGEAVALWTVYNGSYRAIQASMLTSPTGSWTAVENVSKTGEGYEPAIAFNSQGNAIALWGAASGSESAIYAASRVAAGPLLSEVSIPSSGEVGQSLSFSVEPLDPWTSLGSTKWSFGDGAHEEGASVTHAFASPGSYEVEVNSADVLGNVSAETGIVVVRGAPHKESASPEASKQPSAQEVATVKPDTTGPGASPPALALLTKAPQPLINTRSLTLKVACGDAPCSTSTTGWVKLPGSRKTWRLQGSSGAIAGDTTGKVNLMVPRKLRHAVRVYLRHHPHYQVQLHLTVVLSVNGQPSQSLSSTLAIWTYPGFR